MDMTVVSYLLEYGLVVAQQIVGQRQVIAERQRAVDEQHQKVLALSKDAKALEKLRERQLEEHEQDENRRDLAEMGEIASIRHQRLQATAS